MDIGDWRLAVREFCERELRPHAVEWARAGSVGRDLWQQAGRAGLLCPDVPAELGGGGLGFGHEVVVVEEQARAGDTAWGYTAHEVVAQCVLAHGTDDQRASWLPGLASGELVGAIAITEPGAGSDMRSVVTDAEADGDGYVLTGTKTFVTNGLLADLVAILAKVGDRLSVFIVDTRGIEVPRKGIAKIGRRGQDTAELELAGVRVPATDLIGGVPGLGLGQLLPLMSRERLLIAVAATAATEALVAHTIDWSAERVVSGNPLRRFQHTRFALAECATEAAASRAFVDDAVRKHTAGELTMADAAMVKLWATERLATVADRCLQLHGGLGYTAGHPVAEAWADARVTRIYGGTSEVMKDIIAAALPFPRRRS